MIGPTTTLREQAFLVCTALDRFGTTCVLTGGSAATVYAPHDYQSQDMDFVLTLVGRSGNEEALSALGFVRSGSMYVHPANPLTLDFPEGPLAIGGELVKTWDTIREAGLLLHILTPTDCVRDRLAGYLFWHDRQSLAAAVAVARAHQAHVDLDLIEAWCGREGESSKFEDLKRLLQRVA
jgi:hypothetical protein